MKLFIATFGALAALMSAVALGAPAGPPNRGASAADFPPAVWARSGSRQLWLEAPRTGSSPTCSPADARCDQDGPPMGLPERSALVPDRDVRAALTVRVGDVIRFHLTARPAHGIALRIGQRFDVRKRVRAGAVVRLPATATPAWRVPRTAHSGMATLTTTSGTYWFKLAVKR